MTTTGVQDLAREATERRVELGLSREEVADRGGFSIDVVKAVEGMIDRNYRTGTKHAYEMAIEWERGSFDDVLRQVAPPRPLNTSSDDGHPGPLDPMTASNAELGAHADWLSESSGDPEVGIRWLQAVLRKRETVETSHENGSQGDRHAM